MGAYLARYQTQLSELSEKAKQFKGEPLKTTFRVLAGGPHCSSAKQQQSTDSDSSANASLNDVTNAGKAVGKLVGNLFKRKKDDSQSSSDSSAASGASAAPQPAAGTTGSAGDFPQMSQLMLFSTETTSIKTDTLPPNAFDIPPDWTKEAPREAKGTKDDFQCPKGGT
jgi:hypothetical protein